MSRLDALFVIFERITARHGLEKIKTIGDGFMAAGGLLQELEDPIGSAARCGLEMSSTLIEAQLGWEVRVGVHSGPVVAGVVGQERYQFDIWGDTVNVAARMSEKSIPGSVAVTKDVWEHIGHDFDGEALGEMEVKGKGTISVFGIRSRMVVRIFDPRSLVSAIALTNVCFEGKNGHGADLSVCPLMTHTAPPA